MFVKVMKAGESRALYGCAGIETRAVVEPDPGDDPETGDFNPDRPLLERAAVGLEIELIQRHDKESPRVIRLPQDGDLVYIENDRGKTIDRYSWPAEEPVAVAAG